MLRRPFPSLLLATLRGLAMAFLMAVAAVIVARADTAPDGAGITIRLSSLDWPPFSGENLPNRGLTTAIVERTLARTGLSVDVSFLPWQRAVVTGLKDPGAGGLADDVPVIEPTIAGLERALKDADDCSPA